MEMLFLITAIIACILSGCAGAGPTIPPDKNIALLRPYEKMVDNKPVLGRYSGACIQNPGRIVCVNDVTPTFDDVKKRFDWVSLEYLWRLRDEWRIDRILKPNNAFLLLYAVPKKEVHNSFVGFSSEFLGHIMLTTLSAVTKTNMYNNNPTGSFVSGATGAYPYLSSGEAAIKTKQTVEDKQGYMVTARWVDKRGLFVAQSINCPAEVENDQWMCLTSVALALEQASAGK